MSRSCQRTTFSRAVAAYERTSRASPETFSVRIGFRLWGIADEPFWPPWKNSSTSRTSVRCRCRTSTANFSSDVATSASVVKYSAWLSRESTCVEAWAALSPSLRQTDSSTIGSTLAKVPTAPLTLPTATDSRANSSRAMLRIVSSQKSRSLSPKVTGSAWMPCDRPICGVCLNSIARRSSTAAKARRSSSRRSAASTSWSESAVSTTSYEVRPRWTKRASSPARSSSSVRKAMTSWRVVFSISSMRAASPAVSLPTRVRMRAAVPFGTRSSSSIASQARSSISSHRLRRFSSFQIFAISLRVYLGIIAVPSGTPPSECVTCTP